MLNIEESDRSQVIQEKADLEEWESFISVIAQKTKAELDTWFESKFSSLPADPKDGLYTMAKCLWALSKVIKKLWNLLHIFKRL